MPDQPWPAPDSRTCGGSPRRARPTAIWPTWPRRERPTGWSWWPTTRPRDGVVWTAAWVAPPGGSLLLSVLVRPDVEPASMPLLTVAMALAVVDAAPVRHVGGPAQVAQRRGGRRGPAPQAGGHPGRVDGRRRRLDGGGGRGWASTSTGRHRCRPSSRRWPRPPPRSTSRSAPTVDREDLLVAVLRAFEDRCRLLESGGPGAGARLIEAARQRVRHPGPSGARRPGSPIGRGHRRRPGRAGRPDRGRRPRRAAT